MASAGLIEAMLNAVAEKRDIHREQVAKAIGCLDYVTNQYDVERNGAAKDFHEHMEKVFMNMHTELVEIVEDELGPNWKE